MIKKKNRESYMQLRLLSHRSKNKTLNLPKIYITLYSQYVYVIYRNKILYMYIIYIIFYNIIHTHIHIYNIYQNYNTI